MNTGHTERRTPSRPHPSRARSDHALSTNRRILFCAARNRPGAARDEGARGFVSRVATATINTCSTPAPAYLARGALKRVPAVLNPFDSPSHLHWISGCRNGLNPTDRFAKRRIGFDKQQTICWQYRKEISVCAYHYSTERRSPFDVHGVVRTEQSQFGRVHDVHAASSKRGHNARVDTLIRIESKRHKLPPSGLRFRLARLTTLEVCDYCFGSGPILANRFLMIVKIGECGVNVRKSQMGMRCDDLLRRHAHANNFARDLAHLDVGPEDHRPRQRAVDVPLGSGNIASEHGSIVALKPSFAHLRGERSAVVAWRRAYWTLATWRSRDFVPALYGEDRVAPGSQWGPTARRMSGNLRNLVPMEHNGRTSMGLPSCWPLPRQRFRRSRRVFRSCGHKPALGRGSRLTSGPPLCKESLNIIAEKFIMVRPIVRLMSTTDLRTRSHERDRTGISPTC